MDDRKRVIPGTGLKKAQDFQLELTRGKRAQGKTYTDPKLAEESFMVNAEQFILKSSRIKANEKTRKSYLGLLNGDIKKAFDGRTLAQMATQAATARARPAPFTRHRHKRAPYSPARPLKAWPCQLRLAPPTTFIWHHLASGGEEVIAPGPEGCGVNLAGRRSSVTGPGRRW
ncbi:MAG: hypothetical protein ACRDN0_30245 [Trebonia sp.]